MHSVVHLIAKLVYYVIPKTIPRPQTSFKTKTKTKTPRDQDPSLENSMSESK